MKKNVKKQVQGFVSFVREQGVMGLAIGFVLGGSTKDLVSSLVDDVIRPVIEIFIGSTGSIENMAFNDIKYGSFIVSFIDFILMAAVVYFVFKGFKLHRLDLKKENK